MDRPSVLRATERWLDEFVIAENLCPFAAFARQATQCQYLDCVDQGQLIEELAHALDTLRNDDSIETLLLVHPEMLNDFDDYNQFLSVADELLEVMGADGEFQIASFHPEYLFDGTDENAAENFTNRSPFPMLHILREASVEQAIKSHGDAESIPRRNIKLMESIGDQALKKRLADLQSTSVSER